MEQCIFADVNILRTHHFVMEAMRNYRRLVLKGDVKNFIKFVGYLKQLPALSNLHSSYFNNYEPTKLASRLAIDLI